MIPGDDGTPRFRACIEPIEWLITYEYQGTIHHETRTAITAHQAYLKIEGIPVHFSACIISPLE